MPSILERESASVVLLGSFNPAIFQPMWLQNKGLFSLAEAEAAEIGVVHRGLTDFKIAGLRLQVLPERFFAEAAEPQNQVVLRDFVLSTLRILPETPLSRMGLNWQFHFRLESEEQWHTVGHTLAPKEPWQDLIGDAPGLLELRITANNEPGAVTNVALRPSELYPKRGVFFEINSDLTLSESVVEASAHFQGILVESWVARRSRARSICEKVLERILP